MAYADDCLFADPFAGFNGVERFKKNVSNLGGLMQVIFIAALSPVTDILTGMYSQECVAALYTSERHVLPSPGHAWT